MRKNISYTLLLLFLSAALQAQFSISGFVFNDSNNNGGKDKNEKGIAGVPVSNGREVVLTDTNGKYELPVGNDNIIFVIKPSGYKVPVNPNNLPQYYHIHKPHGSPDVKYKGVPPTGNPPMSFDFALYPAIENDNFSMLLFGDPQAYNPEEMDFFYRGIVSELEGIQGIAFGLSLGDLVGDDLNLFKPYIEIINKIGIPWYNVLGNHDLNFDVSADSLSDETFEAHFGPSSYAFNFGKVHFIILDNILYPDPEGKRTYRGGLRDDQFEFLRNNLKFVPQDHLVVLVGHIPLNPEGGNTFRDEDRQKLFDILKNYPHNLSLSAHTHVQKHVFFTKEDGWKQDKHHHHFNVGTTSGSWYTGKPDSNGVPVSTMRDGTPKGYAFLNFKGNNYSINYKVAGKPAEYQMSVYAPKVAGYKSRSWPGIYVNFFIGSSTDEVMFRINKGEWRKMSYFEDYDPGYLAELFKWDSTEQLFPGKRPSNPVHCKHLWRTFVPTDLEPGEHTIEIKATDMFGNEHFGMKKFKILRREQVIDN